MAVVFFNREQLEAGIFQEVLNVMHWLFFERGEKTIFPNNTLHIP